MLLNHSQECNGEAARFANPEAMVAPPATRLLAHLRSGSLDPSRTIRTRSVANRKAQAPQPAHAGLSHVPGLAFGISAIGPQALYQ